MAEKKASVRFNSASDSSEQSVKTEPDPLKRVRGQWKPARTPTPVPKTRIPWIDPSSDKEEL
ncbi:hypothetical protein NEOLI_003895 [Neolecta irregularis DAH-3]|uniref:Uncharacterized protein n=1 Tax=Neolecta irregularis (strain DAH-3) TaxID=1198029 RepID=A0A1U7LT02_NEOID|nr:hypothetical protein NEOLI_003895 [Neolecta irregularis DAH-3]|eukprot:OLL25800.1 hypothetical protein NEOLI_003895 [Neolecta irregularis DAH-3]